MIKSNNNNLWCNKNSIKKYILLSLIIILFILIGGLLYWVIKFTLLPKSCTTTGCLLASAQILTYVDTNVDPCDDFFKFACGNYIYNTHVGVKTAPILKLQELADNQVEEIIREPIKDDDHYLVKRQKMIFNACMNKTAVEEESLGIIQEMLDKLNGWPVVVGLEWNQSLFNWTDMIYKLRQAGYDHTLMLTVGPVIDPRDANQYIIRVEEPFVYVREKNKGHYKNYMVEVAVAMGAERIFAEREMEKVLDFTEKLKIVGKKNNWRTENANDSQVNETAEILSTTFTVEEFQYINNEINWLDFINSILYPSAKIASDDYVIFPKNEFLEAFFSLLSKALKRTQANYIIWSVLENYIQFMSKELQQIRENYIFKTQGSSCPEDRFKFCRDETRALIYPQPTDILYVRRYLPLEKREKVQNLFTGIKSEFVTRLKKNFWMDDTSKEKALEKLNKISEIIGATGNYFNDTIFDYYNLLKKKDFQMDSFFKMYLNCAKDLTDAQYSILYKSNASSSTSKLLTHHSMLTIVNAMFFPEDNTIFLSAGILQGMFYDENRPMYLNYGAIGSVMGHELTHGFGKLANEYEDKNSSQKWSEETAEAYEEASKCVIQDAEDFEYNINGTKTLEENIADYTGIKVSREAYKKWVQDNGEEPYLVGVDYTPYQLFWISAVNLHCYQLKTEEFEKLVKRDNHAFNVFRAIAPLRNNADFANDFNCPLGSKMNPQHKCQVF